jgi:hypothetical protein
MIHDAAQILSTKIAMKKFEEGTDRGEMLIFQSFMHSWVCYECLKVLSVFGLQPTIRADIESWSPQLRDLLTFYSDKTKNVAYQSGASTAVDVLFDSTDHSSYFGKHSFGSKTKFDTSIDPILYLVVLTWSRQLQQFFFEIDDTDVRRDWNKYGRYYGTKKLNQGDFGLGYMHMSTADGNEKTLIFHISCFRPDEKRKGVISSLEEWAARLLQPVVEGLDERGNLLGKETSERLKRAKDPKHFGKFEFTDNDYTNKGTTKTPQGTPTRAKEIIINTSPERHITKSKDELLLSICDTLRAQLSLVKKTPSKRNRENEIIADGVSSFIAFVNQSQDTACKDLEETYTHLDKKVKLAADEEKSSLELPSESDSSSNTSDSDDSKSSSQSK